MKKLLSTLLGLAVICAGSTTFAKECDRNCDFPPPPPGHGKMQKPPHEKLDEKLKLTETQKSLLKKNRIASRQKLKPILQQMFDKREAIMDIRDSELSQAEQDKKIAPLKNDMKTLKQKADAIRKADMEYFESILTTEQKTEFDKIKKEHEKNRHCPPPCPKK